MQPRTTPVARGWVHHHQHAVSTPLRGTGGSYSPSRKGFRHLEVIFWADYWQHAKWIGLALRKLGLERGDVVSILSEDRKEWMWFDMGIQCVGGISSGVYTTDSANQLQYLVNNSGSKFLIVEDEEHLDKFLEVENQVPDLIKVIILEDEGLHDLTHPRCMMIDDLYALGQQAEQEDPGRFEAEIALAKPQDTALLVYTSGTTGQPKGAMLSHENIPPASRPVPGHCRRSPVTNNCVSCPSAISWNATYPSISRWPPAAP